MHPESPIDSHRLDELELFHRALEWGPEVRSERLRVACGGDGALEQRILRLLRADQGVQESWPSAVSWPVGHDWTGRMIGRTIGRYRVLEWLGRGGMGVVYRAEQDHPRREIALKVLLAHRLQERFLKRFETEAQVLGLLSHPGIAQVFEASVVEVEGQPQPYFAMELVEGTTIDHYARELPRVQTLGLLAQVCDALHHAHQKGVVHRDLKPGNVLVTADGHPKVVDFGIAHVESDFLEGSLFETRDGEILGTLASMSPEQVSPRCGPITPRTDVYALGALGYRLLAGRDPLQLEGLSVAEIAQRIEHQAPQPLGSIDDSLRGDVEVLIGKAMAKDPERRYAHAGELAADLRRHLAQEPIQARPPSTVYVLRKFVARNRAAVGGLALAFVALLVGLLVSTALYWNAKESWAAESKALGQARAAERSMRAALDAAEAATERAREDERVADETAQFVASLFRLANPLEHPKARIEARTFLDLGAQSLELSGDRGPRVKAKLGGTMAGLYRAMGLYSQGRTWGRRALAWLEELAPEKRAALSGLEMDLLGELALLENNLGDWAAATECSLDLVQLADRRGEGDTWRVAAEWTKLASLYARQGKLEPAREALEKAKQRAARSEVARSQERDGYRFWELQARGNVALAAGQSLELLELRREAMAHAEAHLAETWGLVVLSRKGVLEALEQLGRLEEALEFSQGLLDELRTKLSEDHPSVLLVQSTQGLLLQELGQYQEAWEVCTAIEAPLRQTFGDGANEYLTNQANLAGLCAKTGRLEEAQERYRRVLDSAEASTALSPDALAKCRLDYAYLLMTHLDQGEQAQPILERALQELDAAGLRTGPTYRFGQKAYGLRLQQAGQLAEACEVYSRLLAAQRQDLGAEHPDIAETLHNLALLERSRKQPQAALDYHEQCLQILQAAYPEGHALFGYAHHGVGEMHAMLKDFRAAEAAFQKALEVRSAALPAGHYMTETSRMALASALFRQGRVPEARVLFEKAEPRLRAALPADHFFLRSVDAFQEELDSE